MEGWAWRFSLHSIRRDIFSGTTGPCVSNWDQRILQRVWCSGPGQRSRVDLAANLRGVRGASRYPAALVSQARGISLITIVRSRFSDGPCRSAPAVRMQRLRLHFGARLDLKVRNVSRLTSHVSRDTLHEPCADDRAGSMMRNLVSSTRVSADVCSPANSPQW